MSYINYYDSGFTLITNGTHFPNTDGGVSSLLLLFSSPVTVNIDFGNGVSVDYPSKASGGNNWVYLYYSSDGSQPSYSYPAYTYPDGLTIDRRINISIPDADRTKLTQIGMRGFNTMPPQFLTVSFNTYPNLTTLSLTLLNNAILGIDPSFLTIPGFTTYIVGNTVTNPSSSFYGVIPAVVLAKSTLTTLSIGDPGLQLKSFADSNLDKIAISYPVLQSLTISQMGTGDNHMGDGALPANLSTMTTLTAVAFHGTAWTTFPTILNSISNYTSLGVIYSNTVTSWGDLTTVAPRLVTLNVAGLTNLTTTLPSWFTNLTSMRIFSWNTIGLSGTANINTFISNWYTFITTNAAMTGANTLPFRGITLNIGGDPSPSRGVIPTGTYQQPTGYVQGSSNGTPASSQEMLWVLANQYGHTNNYRTI